MGQLRAINTRNSLASRKDVTLSTMIFICVSHQKTVPAESYIHANWLLLAVMQRPTDRPRSCRVEITADFYSGCSAIAR